MALGLTNKRAEIFTLVEVELVERETLLEPITNLIRPTAANLLITL